MGFDLDDYEVVKAGTLTTPNSIMIYGPSGKGKTVMAGSIIDVPGFERVLVMDTEGSATSLSRWHPDCDVIAVKSAAHFNAMVEALVNGEYVQKSSGLPYQAVIVDTFDKAFERQLDVFSKAKEAYGTKGEYNSYYQWGAIKIWVSKVADALHYSDFLTIWVIHEDKDKDENTGKVTIGVLLSGKSQQSFPSVADINIYYHMEKLPNGEGKKEDQRVAEFRPSDNTVAKQRFSDLLNVGMLEPSMVKVFKAIEPERWEK